MTTSYNAEPLAHTPPVRGPSCASAPSGARAPDRDLLISCYICGWPAEVDDRNYCDSCAASESRWTLVRRSDVVVSDTSAGKTVAA